jgi:hypothetical protein
MGTNCVFGSLPHPRILAIHVRHNITMSCTKQTVLHTGCIPRIPARETCATLMAADIRDLSQLGDHYRMLWVSSHDRHLVILYCCNHVAHRTRHSTHGICRSYKTSWKYAHSFNAQTDTVVSQFHAVLYRSAWVRVRAVTSSQLTKSRVTMRVRPFLEIVVEGSCQPDWNIVYASI